MSKPTKSRDGRERVTVRVTYRLDLYELTCAAALAWNSDDKPTAKAIRAAVTGRMQGHGDYPGMDYGDQLLHDDGELAETFDMLRPHVARAYGFKEDK